MDSVPEAYKEGLAAAAASSLHRRYIDGDIAWTLRPLRASELLADDRSNLMYGEETVRQDQAFRSPQSWDQWVFGTPMPRVLLQGQPGAGKSTALGQLTLDLLEKPLLNEGRPHYTMPILLDAEDLSDRLGERSSAYEFTEAVVEIVHQNYGPGFDSFVGNHLHLSASFRNRQCEVLLLIDGLDEAGIKNIGSALSDFAHQSNAGLIATSRPHADIARGFVLSEFTHLLLAPLEPADTERLVREAIASKPAITKLVDYLSIHRHLATNPLRLRLVCIAFSRMFEQFLDAESDQSQTGFSPKNWIEHQLYTTIIRGLLSGRWQSTFSTADEGSMQELLGLFSDFAHGLSELGIGNRFSFEQGKLASGNKEAWSIVRSSALVEQTLSSPPRFQFIHPTFYSYFLNRYQGISPDMGPLAVAIRTAEKANLAEAVRAHRYAHFMYARLRLDGGETFITNPVAVATHLADLGFGTATLVAALLHDVVRDSGADLEEIRDEFGDDVADLVGLMTQLGRIQVESKQEQQAETLRKMIVATGKDIRVLVIKLADRLHNMETIGSMPREKQKRFALETLDIYAPLAHRLGMQTFKRRLEELGFQTLHPKRYDEIVAMVEERNPEREAYIEEVVGAIQEQLKELRIKGEVTGRLKHYFSIYEKMVLRGKEFDEIHDLVGVRVIVGSVRDCYAVLGQLHATWRPVPGRFKDYIAMPKVNLYQSLHTSVIGPKGRPLEVQVCTRAMYQTAEFGIAVRSRDRGSEDSPAEELPWIAQLLEWQQDVEEPGDYLESLKIDLYQDEVFVFTAKGEVMGLPVGATPIDFAYAVHTEVGHRCIGARVNGRLVPLDHQLANGDSVEVLTSKAEDAGPSRDWLQLAASPRAKAKIRAFFDRERREDAIVRGRDALTRALRRKGINYSRVMATGDLAEVARALSYKNTESLFRAIGEQHVAATTVAQQVVNEPTEQEAEPAETLESLVESTVPIKIGSTAGGEDIEVEGDAGVLVKLARCCTPVPGDSIVGFVTRGEGVSVHRSTCSNVRELERDPDRFAAVDWSGETTASFLVAIGIEALDRKHLLRDITAVLSDLQINIASAQLASRKDRVAHLKFSFELGDPTLLEEALRSIQRVEGIYDAYRLVPQDNGVARR